MSSSSNSRGNYKGKGRANGSRGGGGGGGGGQRVRRAADYTPVQEPLAGQAQIQDAARLAVEREEERLSREKSRNPVAEEEAGAVTGDGNENGDTAAEEEEQLCYICAEPVRYWMLGTCNHRTCHVCSLRLRALYKKRECTFCKLDLPTVLCTTDSDTTFQDFPPDAFPCSDAKLGIAFQSAEMMEDTLTLLRFNCPRINCDYLGTGWPDLKKHVRQEHDRVFCDLCTKFKKIFAHEHSLFTNHGLQNHIKEGDAAEDQESTGFNGHPMCEFCRITFFDSDQLFTHCRDKHEQCHICVRNGTGRYQYYIDYHHLENHFQAAHYLCLNNQCLDQRFIVFDTEIDLQAHQLSEHGATTIGGSGTATGKTARRLETNFSYATPTHDPRAGGGVSMRPRNGRTNEQQQQQAQSSRQAAQASSATQIVQPIPEYPTMPVAAGPSNGVLGSRGRLVPGLQRGGFNTSLSTTDDGQQMSKKEGKKAASSTMADTVTGVKQTDPVMAARHASLLTRVSEAVGGSDAKLASFRSAVRTYRSNESSAEDTIKTIHSILDNQTDLTSKIVHNTADLLDKNDKRIELLEAWDRQQSSLLQNVDYFPSLVPTAPTSNFPSMSSASVKRTSPAARRSITKSTKQTSSAVWERVADAAANKNVGAVPGLTARAPLSANKEKFPALPIGGHAVSSHAVRGATPWASSRSQATSPGSTYFPVASSAAASLISSPARPRSPALPKASASTQLPPDFPSLPAAAQAKARAAQKAAIFNRPPPGTSSGLAQAKPWGAPSPPLLSEDVQMQQALQQSLRDLQLNGEGQSADAARKKKKGKQVLLKFGL